MQKRISLLSGNPSIVRLFSKALYAAANILRIFSFLLITKVVAFTIGPIGIALTGQFQNFMSIIQVLSHGGINLGVMKYVAEYSEDSGKRGRLIGTAFFFTSILSVLLLLILTLWSSWFSEYFLSSAEYKFVIILGGLFISGYGFQMVFNSILNGKRDYNKFTYTTFVSSIIGLVYSLTCIYFYNLTGALIAIATFQSVGFVVSTLVIYKDVRNILGVIKFSIDWGIIRKLLDYSLFTVVNSICIPVSQIAVRELLIDRISLESAGIWDGMNRVSYGLLLLSNTVFSAYFIPIVSSNKYEDIKKWIWSVFFKLIASTAALCVGVYLFRDIIIQVFFSQKFHAMRDLFLYQLAGDFFRLAGWFFGCILLAKAFTKLAIVMELIFTLVLFVSLCFTGVRGADSFSFVSGAYAINYFLYFLLSVFLFFGFVKNKI